jgi:hypothetical protein
MPTLTLRMNDLYPESTTRAQVYKGPVREDVTGTTVPGTYFANMSAVPASRILQLSGYESVFDSDGLWTMELLTQTPFGTDRLASVSFTMEGLGMTPDGWRQANFNSTENSGDGANLADPDHDGLANLIEFAFGLDPQQPGAGGLPAPQMIGGHQVISFNQPAAIKGITYGAEWSDSLLPGSWLPVPDTAEPPEHRFSVPAGAGGRAFLRLKVTEP